MSTPPAVNVIAARLADLQRQRDLIDAEMLRLVSGLRPSDRPLRTCLRCGHQWRSFSWLHLPRSCARCGSSGWNLPPVAPDARHPEDPPNPRWRARRPMRPRRPVAREGGRFVAMDAPVRAIPPPPRLDPPPAPPAYVPPRVEVEPQPESFLSRLPVVEGEYVDPEPETEVMPLADEPSSVRVEAGEHRAADETSAATPPTDEVADVDAWLAERDRRVAAILAGQPEPEPLMPVPDAAAVIACAKEDADADA